MKKKTLSKLTLNKVTIASLNDLEMILSRGGADPTMIGRTCYTSRCCKTNNRDCDDDEEEMEKCRKA